MSARPEPPDAVAFRAAYAEHRDAVWRYVGRRVDDPHAVDDLTTEVFIVAWRRRREVPPAAVLPWLYGVAAKVLANHRRGAGRRAALHRRAAEHAATAAPAAADPAERIGAREALLGALDRLGERDREVLLLAAWEGLEPAELAVALGCRRGAAGVRLHRARKRLRALLDESEAAPGAAPLGPALTTTTDR